MTILIIRTVQLFKYTLDMLFQCMLSDQVELNNEQSLTSKDKKHSIKQVSYYLSYHKCLRLVLRRW